MLSMFKIIVNGRNLDLTEGIKSKVTERLERLEHHYDFISEIHVFISVEKNPRIKDNQIIEATIHVSRAILRVEVASDDLYHSIDLLGDKVERSLRRHKTKLLGRAKSSKEGESIRKVGFEEQIAKEEAVQNDSEEIEGVYLTLLAEDGTPEEEEARV